MNSILKIARYCDPYFKDWFEFAGKLGQYKWSLMSIMSFFLESTIKSPPLNACTISYAHRTRVALGISHVEHTMTTVRSSSAAAVSSSSAATVLSSTTCNLTFKY